MKLDLTIMCEIGEFMDGVIDHADCPSTPTKWDDVEKIMFAEGLWPQGYHTHITEDPTDGKIPWFDKAVNELLKENEIFGLSLTEQN